MLAIDLSITALPTMIHGRPDPECHGDYNNSDKTQNDEAGTPLCLLWLRNRGLLIWVILTGCAACLGHIVADLSSKNTTIPNTIPTYCATQIMNVT